MAERLTEQKTRKGVTKIVVKPFVDMYIVVHKLYLLEDIMEKYHCNDIEELEKKLADSDTWQKACELACEREDDCYVYDNIHRAYEFYQQAKTEGNDERD